MPPVMMTKVIGSAMRPISVINRPWLSRLSTRQELFVQFSPSPISATMRIAASTVS